MKTGLVRDGQVLDPPALGEAIGGLLKSTGISGERVIVGLAGLPFTYRYLDLPRMKPAMLDEAILRAARKEISLSLDELYLTWQLLPGKGEESSYFVLGVPRNPIDALEETLKIAGAAPYLVDLQPLALARAAGRRDAIVVNMGPDCFDIVFIAGGIPAVIHTINPRSEGATLEDNIKRLSDELTKMSAFYQNRYPLSPMSPATPLLLTGDLALELTASGLLQAETEYPVEPLVPQLDCPPELPAAAYAATIGLALKKLPSRISTREDGRFYDINVNLLSGKYRKIRARPKSVRMMVFASVMAAAVIALFPLYQARTQAIEENARRQIESSRLNRELNLAGLIQEENARTEDTIREINAATGALQAADRSVLSVRGDFARNLQFVTGTLPASADFTMMEMDDHKVTVRGETDSVFTVVDYALALEEKGIFPEVRITELDESVSTTAGSDTTGETPTFGRIVFSILMNK